MSILQNISVADRRRSQLDASTFETLRSFIYDETGIYFQDNKRYLLESRVSRRLKALQVPSFEDYTHQVTTRRQRDELGPLINAITINETFFFRHQAQYDVLVDHLIPTLIEKRGPRCRLRFWSAASSTGEEAYSLALLFEEKVKPRYPNVRLDIVATDIDTDAIQEARDGLYNSYATRNVPNAWLRKYFTEEDRGHRLSADIRRKVRFKQVNLADRMAMQRMRNFDVIFCANVLIYFDDTSKQQVVASLYNSLGAGGYLFVGFSESLYGVTQAFHAVRIDKTTAYQKV
ncbi:MAG: protein-glutamate O-methyltransferase CheR [Bacteroidetes bacterium]|jgi:chemotaxis protein methyltransferase CheR|nr:protein-glutamate O-methyltransferase CheR [Bacteroidota bacterium]